MIRTAADDGAAILVVSHDETRLASYADRLVRMHDGALAELEAHGQQPAGRACGTP